MRFGLLGRAALFLGPGGLMNGQSREQSKFAQKRTQGPFGDHLPESLAREFVSKMSRAHSKNADQAGCGLGYSLKDPLNFAPTKSTRRFIDRMITAAITISNPKMRIFSRYWMC